MAATTGSRGVEGRAAARGGSAPSGAGVRLACRAVVERLDDYLEGTLPPAESAPLDGHLRRCGGCGRYLEQLRTTIRLSGWLGDACPDTDAVVLGAFRARKMH